MGAISAWRALLKRMPVLDNRRTLPPASPWSTGQLQAVVWSDIFGADEVPVTRAQCMAIPAVARARHLIAGTFMRQPLKAYRGGVEVSTREQPAWMYRTNGDVSPQHRMLWTYDDLIFGGWSLWAAERGAGGKIADAWRVPAEWWHFDTDGKIYVNDEEVTEDSAILFPGPFEGLIEAGAHTIRAAHNIERAWAKRVRQPVPAVELHETTEDELEDGEIKDLLDDWSSMVDAGGGAAYTPYNIELKTHGEATTDLFVEGRNAVTLDIARMLNVPATVLDASMATASLQYVTAVDGRTAFHDQTLAFWSTPVEARLSMDDVVPRGQRTGFDLANLTVTPQPATGPATED